MASRFHTTATSARTRAPARRRTSAPGRDHARLLERTPDLDAVFVASDLMAAGALATLRATGRRVPEDVAVGGFDDSSVAASTHPPLTTIRQPLAQVAEETVRLLLELIDGAGHVDPVILPTRLIVREST
ncbi:substrate-binding domain-containing protein [Microbispora sp. ATCC PTA-5024]|uniref:substrate-binding domain-containing protein n=1 Tax=Microbispora sp. ATCC PTA-5024 TaxID=316330 RepID=UPI0003DD7F4D|nr:substrate-binding domain-containing protein [Microbispora sp. ATCC PTA-5024]ETK32146.1 hypothetical protein MPTA5024_31255 [Microbispora sp. ATCC PTA-5024]